MRKLSVWICCLVLAGCLGAAAAPKLGTRSDAIGTFNGWVFVLGWEGSFSDTYAPEKEKYSWNVFLAPEAIYVGLLGQQAVYSGVDVNMAIKYFYGWIQAPNGGPSMEGDFLAEDVWAVSFSVGYPDAVPPVGLMAHFSLGFEVEQAFFRIKNTRQMIPGVQWGAGYSAAYSLLPVSLPFSVELDREWVAPPAEPDPSLFWPIIIWNRTADPGRSPLDQVQDAVRILAAGGGGGSASSALLGSSLQVLVDRVAVDSDLRAYLNDPTGPTRIRQAISATETWLVTGDTRNLSEALKPLKGHTEVTETVQRVLSVTQVAFETGYRVGAQANTNNRTVYVDGVVTNYCVVGEKCVLEVPVAELIEAIPGRTAAEFEGVWVGFDVPMEGAGAFSDLGRVEWVQVEGGAARFTMAQSLSTPELLGVRYDDSSERPLNGNRDVELKRRLIVFVDPTDRDANRIPDFWEDGYGLTDRSDGADADGDGMTDYQEYLADTNPTNAQSQLTLDLSKARKELVLPFASNVRRYAIEVNTGSVGDGTGWREVMSFMGSDAAEAIDLSEVFGEPKAFFRLRVEKP